MKLKFNHTQFKFMNIIEIALIGAVVPSFLPIVWRLIVQIGLILGLGFIYYRQLKSCALVSKQRLAQYNLEFEEKNKMLHTQKVMLELSNQMIQVNNFEDLMNTILQKAIEVIPKARYGSILVMNDDQMLEFKALVGFDEALYEVRLKPEASYQWQATGGDFKEPVIIKDLMNFTRNFMDDENYETMKDADALNINSTLSAPILLEGQFFGSINIDSEEQDLFSEQDVKVMAYFANQASVAIANHKLYEKMHFLSKHDDLTGVLNRNSLETAFEMMMKRHEDTPIQASVVVIDLNEFKMINDSYGHAAGDKVLEVFAERCKSKIKKTDVISRFGGDEFVIVFYNSHFQQTEVRMCELAETITSDPIHLKDQEMMAHIDFSYGIAESPLDGTRLKELLRVADKRMYDFKRNKAKKEWSRSLKEANWQTGKH